jgi:hypothetical protein
VLKPEIADLLAEDASPRNSVQLTSFFFFFYTTYKFLDDSLVVSNVYHITLLKI